MKPQENQGRPTRMLEIRKEALRPCMDELVSLRHYLHQHPELGFEEFNTSSTIARELTYLGLQPEAGIGRTGVVAVIEGLAGHSDRAIALRADIDALPIAEENTFEHASRCPGKMHGCGHDGHIVMLLAAARLLMRERKQFSGRVVLIFQPGEEGHAGARAMLQDGLLERYKFDEIYGLHNWPGLEAHHVALNPGRMMAGIDRFEATIRGKGGHGGHQYQTNDPIMPLIQIVQSMQTIISKNVSAFDEAVVSLNLVQAGSPGALSVVPAVGRVEGMTKWFDDEVGVLLEARISELLQGIGRAFGVSVEHEYEKLYPPTVNHSEPAKQVFESACKVLGAGQCHWGVTPSMGSEDFAFFLRERPGAFYRLGQGRDTSPLHSPTYDFNDGVLPTGAALHFQIAVDALRAS